MVALVDGAGKVDQQNVIGAEDASQRQTILSAITSQVGTRPRVAQVHAFSGSEL
jgi:hypothetical protein